MSYRLLARSPGEEGLVPAELDRFDGHADAGALLWLDVSTRDPEEMDQLGQRFEFDPAAIEDVIDVEQLPKFEIYDDHIFVVLHALISDDDRLDTHEVDCFVRPNLLVTVRSAPVAGLEWLWQAVQTHPHLAEHGAEELFAQLTEVMGRRYLELLDEFDTRIDELSDRALEADQRVLAEIQLLRREEATIRRMLGPQRRVIAGLRANAQAILDREANRILIDSYDIHNLVVESLAATRGLLTDTLDTYRGASAERQASATTVLTVYAAILLPLSLITSWYGMNVGNLPGSSNSWGWMAVTGVMLAFAVGSWIVFVKAGLVHWPRFGPRPIVRSLSAVARAPVRPFTMLWRPSKQEPDRQEKP
ncbi:MAG: magnesium transporter CorA family protein [Acidimicrobiia bacterium]|nr:magnesium transporter CorA family protein [Acidimicrobiia bacterium]